MAYLGPKDKELEAQRLEGEIAEVCGVLNAASARLVGLISEVLDTGSWTGVGIRSAEHWVSWQCGVSPGHARSLVATARRLAELPQTAAAFAAGQLSEDQVKVVCRHLPARHDDQIVELARNATVTQLQRTLSSYAYDGQPAPDGRPPEERRRVGFGHTDDGDWRLSARLGADEGAIVQKALESARHGLFHDDDDADGDGDDADRVSWADALVRVADRALSAEATDRPHRDRHLVLLHLKTDEHAEAQGGVDDGADVQAGERCHDQTGDRTEAGNQQGHDQTVVQPDVQFAGHDQPDEQTDEHDEDQPADGQREVHGDERTDEHPHKRCGAEDKPGEATNEGDGSRSDDDPTENQAAEQPDDQLDDPSGDDQSGGSPHGGHRLRAHLHLGPGLPDTLHRYLTCDGRIRMVAESDGRPINEGHTYRIVPAHTRRAVEERDRGCLVPGCPRTRWLHIHHITHWEHGGRTDTANLIALCQPHHRLHHQGLLGIAGDPDRPDDMVFSDQRGRRLTPHAAPKPPGDPPGPAARRLGLPVNRYRHPLGERLQNDCILFRPPPKAPKPDEAA
ncbi:hypothetical protein BH20ACT2_BH20ACT2_03470 [soil metagenome]